VGVRGGPLNWSKKGERLLLEKDWEPCGELLWVQNRGPKRKKREREEENAEFLRTSQDLGAIEGEKGLDWEQDLKMKGESVNTRDEWGGGGQAINFVVGGKKCLTPRQGV